MTLALAQSSFPVRYVQEHVYDMPRSKWVMLTGLPENASAENLVAVHEEVVRKSLQRGLHKGLLWQPEPDTHDFPTKEQANLMDTLADREASDIPIEVGEIIETEDGISASYLVVVEEEQLVEEEQRQLGPPEPGTETPSKIAGFPSGPFVAGAAVGAFVGWLIVPRGIWVKSISATAVGLFSGYVVAEAARRK